MPLAYGGGVRTINDFKKLFNIGIEKIIVNTLIFDNPKIVKIATEKYGSQSIVASIDVKKNNSDNYIVFSHSNRKVKHDFKKFINYVIKLNVGEILITSVDQDGTWDGYDEKLIDCVNKITSVPIIANGGCGRVEDLKNILYKTGIQAAALGSMAVYQKKGMGVLIRFPKRNKIIIDE